MSRQVKKKCDPIADGIEHGLDAAHRVVDHLLWPLKPIDSVIHGTARGVKNWLCDEHPADNTAKPKTTKKKKKKLAVDSCSSDNDSDGSGSPPPCKGKGGHHNVGKFGSVKKNHANGAGNNNNVNGKLAAKMGNQKLHSSSSDDDSSDDDDSDGSGSPPPCKGKGKGGHHNVGKFGNVKNNHANGAGNNNNVNGKLDAKMGNQKLHRKK